MQITLLFLKIFIFKSIFTQNEVSETSDLHVSTAASGDEKLSPFILFSMYGNKKKSLGKNSGEYGQ